ncbi:MAG: helix-turn-helix transcriptional regulator [Alphaproteobacteria bacterium]|nr:helix-turn-helix transcriptional regulator [Alphaproteobacteria bacterium]
MKLKTYIIAHGISLSEMARQLETSPQNVHLWAESRRIPREDMMRRIFELTAGMVAPNDFYDLPSLDGAECPPPAEDRCSGPAAVCEGVAA